MPGTWNPAIEAAFQFLGVDQFNSTTPEISPPQIGAVASKLVSASTGDIAVVFSRAPACCESEGYFGFKPKWPGKIATLVSATAITIACGFGAAAAVFNKELSPKADTQKYSFGHPAKLRWLFDEDPGSLTRELSSKYYIAKIRPIDRLESITDIMGGLRPGRIKAKVIKGRVCQLNEGDVADMSLDLPSDFPGWRPDLQNLYDVTNIFDMKIGREYYVIASCTYGPRLAYVIE
jgi:hypothetical protein